MLKGPYAPTSEHEYALWIYIPIFHHVSCIVHGARQYKRCGKGSNAGVTQRAVFEVGKGLETIKLSNAIIAMLFT
jgi:hypothetical protein